MTPYEVASGLGRFADEHGVLGDITIHPDGRVSMDTPTRFTPVASVKLTADRGRTWCINVRTNCGWMGWSDLNGIDSLDAWMESLRTAIEIADDANREVREGSL